MRKSREVEGRKPKIEISGREARGGPTSGRERPRIADRVDGKRPVVKSVRVSGPPLADHDIQEINKEWELTVASSGRQSKSRMSPFFPPFFPVFTCPLLAGFARPMTFFLPSQRELLSLWWQLGP